MRQTSRVLHASIKYGLEHRAEGLQYAAKFGRGLDASRTDRFVGMYVNELTLGYGERGKQAVRRFLEDAWEAKLLPARPRIDFVE
jgi:5,8-dihydroxy-2-naphthoate synthase